MSIELPAAVLWDMDGTLVDTEPYWMRAETELVGSFGGEWTTEDALEVIGAGLWVSASALQSHGVDLPVDEIVDTLTSRVLQQLADHGVPWRPGALALLTETREHGIPTALVTMSVARMAEQIVSHIPFDAFDVLVTGDSVENPKPDPEAYLNAARLIGVDPAHAVAIEDSAAGLASAVGAGTVAVAVPHFVAIPASPEYTVWQSLEGRSLGDLAGLFGTRSADACDTLSSPAR